MYFLLCTIVKPLRLILSVTINCQGTIELCHLLVNASFTQRIHYEGSGFNLSRTQDYTGLHARVSVRADSLCHVHTERQHRNLAEPKLHQSRGVMHGNTSYQKFGKGLESPHASTGSHKSVCRLHQRVFVLTILHPFANFPLTFPVFPPEYRKHVFQPN